MGEPVGQLGGGLRTDEKGKTLSQSIDELAKLPGLQHVLIEAQTFQMAVDRGLGHGLSEVRAENAAGCRFDSAAFDHSWYFIVDREAGAGPDTPILPR